MSTDFYRPPEFNDSLPQPRMRRQFKLIELMAVVAILAVLIALFLPVVRSAGPAAFRAQCVNNLKQIALALHTYEKAYGALPPAYTVDAQGRPLHSWRTLILPYLEQKSLYAAIDLSKPWNDPVNAKALNTSVPDFRCPSSREPVNTTTYLAIVADNACLLPTKPRRLAEITDGLSSTLMVIEAGEENAVPWMAPTDAAESLVLNLGAPNSKLHHPGGMNASFVDGSVHFIKGNTKPDVLRALFSISGGEITEIADY
jgi:prepilin-type processing-associated H-X9-DG protein